MYDVIIKIYFYLGCIFQPTKFESVFISRFGSLACQTVHSNKKNLTSLGLDLAIGGIRNKGSLENQLRCFLIIFSLSV